MILENSTYVRNEVIQSRLSVLVNQTYRLLPTREEGNDWQKPLNTIIEELEGMSMLFFKNHDDIFFPLLCKLKGLLSLLDEKCFQQYRSTIFECLNLMGRLRSSCQDQMICD